MTKISTLMAGVLLCAAGIPALAQEAMTVPYFIAPTQAQFNECVVLDANDDGKTWTFISESINYGYHSTNTANDWIFFPAVQLKSGLYEYQVTYWAKGGYDEKLKFTIGSAATPEGQDRVLGDVTYKQTPKKTFVAEFEITESGVFYPAIQVCSDPDKFGIYCQDISIMKKDPNMPAEIVSYNHTIEGCDLSVGVKLPEQTVTGAQLAGPVSLVVTVDDSPAVTNPAEVSGAPGDSLEFSIVLERGTHKINIAPKVVVDGEDLVQKAVSFTVKATKPLEIPLPVPFAIVPEEDDVPYFTILNLNEDSSGWEFTSNGPDGDNTFRCTYDYSNASNYWLITPQINTSAGGAYKLSFKARSNGERILRVCWGTDSTAEAMINEIYVNNALSTDASYIDIESTFGVPAGENIYIGFHNASPRGSFNLFVKDIRLETTAGLEPSCPTVEIELDGGNGTAKVTLPANTIAGEAIAAETVKATLVIDGSADLTFEQEAAPGAVVEFPLSDLPLGRHTVSAYVSYVAGEETHTGKATVTEVRVEMSSDFAYELPFEFTPNTGLLDFVKIFDLNGDGKTWYINETQDYEFCILYNSNLDADDWVILPPVRVNDDAEYKFTVKAAASQAAYPESLELWIGNAQTPDSMSVKVIDVPQLKEGKDGQTYPALQESTVRISTPGRYFIGIHGCSKKDMSRLFVSTVTMELVPGTITGIESVDAEDAAAPVEYFNLQGMRVDNPVSGLYIKRQGHKAVKVLIRK